MGEVVHLDGPRRFTLVEARDLVPVLHRITEEAVTRIGRLQAHLLAAEEGGEAEREARAQIESVYRGWAEKMQRLGGHPKGPWLVDLDNGDDFYCWRWPEEELAWAHAYEGGYAARYALEEEE